MLSSVRTQDNLAEGVLGETFLHYRILGRLGAGGMGEVYRARDERLHRDVAVKALPETFAKDSERLRRLRAEARAMAAVSHPNVAAIHTVEEHEGQVILVLELAEGKTLAKVLEEEGPLPPTRAVNIAGQIAAGLAAAHAQGIVHRDLKPGNVMVGAKDHVRILDFGIARPLRPPTPDANLTDSPTLTWLEETDPGVIRGTAPYLSPEQVRGEEIDPRADIWAFGCLLYETLTGRRAFARSSLADTLAAVVSADPDWAGLPADLPESIRWILERCLDKDPDQRIHSAADLRLLVERLGAPGSSETRGAPRRPSASSAAWLAGIGAAAVAGWTLAWLLFHERPHAPPPEEVVRFSLFADPLDPMVSFAPSWQLSPDDRLFAYQTVPEAGAQFSTIRLRSLQEGTVRELDGTEGARRMTFSPDGTQMAFLQGKELRRVRLSDGTTDTLAALPSKPELWFFLEWTDEGSLIISSWVPRGLWRVDPSGAGQLQKLNLHDAPLLSSGTDQFLTFPSDLPGDRYLLYTLRRLPKEDRIETLSLETGERSLVAPAGNRGLYVPPGFVAFHSQSRIFVIPFDPRTGRPRGEAVAMVDGVRSYLDQTGMFSVSRSGSLAYAPGGRDPEVRWSFASRGKIDQPPQPLPIASSLRCPRVSPDGGRLVFASSEGSDRSNLWIYDFERETARRITDEEGNEWWSAWGPDGRLVFQSDREDHAYLDLYVMDPDRPGSTRKILDGGECYLQPQQWLPDGRLLYQRGCVETGTLGMFTVDLETGEVQPLREDAARDKHPSVSPDGRWLAFASDLSGEDQVYLTSFPEPGRLTQVSPAGGDGPLWSPAGDGLYFHSANRLFFVSFDAEAATPLGAPEVAVRGVRENSYVGRNYDVFPDGRLLVPWGVTSPVREVEVVLHWSREIAERLAAQAAQG